MKMLHKYFVMCPLEMEEELTSLPEARELAKELTLRKGVDHSVVQIISVAIYKAEPTVVVENVE